MEDTDSIDDIKKILDKPKMKVVQYESNFEKNQYIFEVISKIKKMATEYDEKFSKFLKERKDNLLKSSSASSRIFNTETDNPFKVIKKELGDLENLLEELGLWSFCKAYQDSVQRILNNFNSVDKSLNNNVIDLMKTSLTSLFNQHVRSIISEEDENNLEKILELSSVKVNCLLDIFNSYKATPKFHSIVFVDRKTIAFHLNLIIQNLSQLDEWKFIKSDYLFSDSGSYVAMSATKQVN